MLNAGRLFRTFKEYILTLRSYKPYTGLLLLYVSCLHKTMASSILSFYVMYCWHRVGA